MTGPDLELASERLLDAVLKELADVADGDTVRPRIILGALLERAVATNCPAPVVRRFAAMVEREPTACELRTATRRALASLAAGEKP